MEREQASGTPDPDAPIDAPLELDAEAGPDLPSASLAAGVGSLGARRPARHDALSEIWALSWPVMLSQVLLNVVGLVDIAMVGRLGAGSVAAVGYATQFFHLSQSVLFAVGFACVALMAQAIGAGDRLRARRALAAALLVSTGAALVLTSAMLGASAALLRMLGAAPDVIARGVPYLRLVVGSSLLLAVSMTYEFGFRADRNARTPMQIAVVVTAVKLGGNALLIFGTLGAPRLELVGAGIATLASQVVGITLFLAVALRADPDSPLRLRPADFAAARPLVPEVVRLALPSLGERLANNFALLAYFRVLSGYGSIAIATYTVGIRLLAFTWIPGMAFGTAASTLVGQALGARERDAATRTGWRTTRLALGVALVLGVACLISPASIARLFTDDAQLVAALAPFLVCLALAQPFLQSHFALGGAHRGAGDTFTPFVASVLGNWGIRVPLAALFALVWTAPVLWIWIVIVVDHAVRASWLALSFRRGRWRQRA